MATTRKKGEELKEEIKANASKVWLAGLGALATAEEEGGKIFRGLVRKGESYEKKGLAQIDSLKERVEELAGTAKDRFGDLREAAQERAEGAWEKVGAAAEAAEERWDDKVHGVLRRIGVPSRNEIAALTRRVEELTAMVGSKAKSAAKPAARKAAKSKKATATRKKK